MLISSNNPRDSAIQRFRHTLRAYRYSPLAHVCAVPRVKQHRRLHIGNCTVNDPVSLQEEPRMALLCCYFPQMAKSGPSKMVYHQPIPCPLPTTEERELYLALSAGVVKSLKMSVSDVTFRRRNVECRSLFCPCRHG